MAGCQRERAGPRTDPPSTDQSRTSSAAAHTHAFRFHELPVLFGVTTQIDMFTDVPTMKMMHTKGGFSIAVYDPRSNERDQAKVYSLISEDRVNFVAAADYREGSALDLIVKGLVGRIAINSGTAPAGL